MNSGRSVMFFVLVFITLLPLSSAWSYDTFESVGEGATIAVVVAAGGITLARNDREGLIQLVMSGAVDLGVTYGLKYTVHARRPDDSDNQSFPSAHSSLAFTSAEYLRKRYGWEYGLPAYGLAAVVACSRVEADKHYTRDVLAGALIGMASSYLFTTPYVQGTMTAEAAPGYYGFRLTKAW